MTESYEVVVAGAGIVGAACGNNCVDFAFIYENRTFINFVFFLFFTVFQQIVQQTIGQRANQVAVW